MTKTTPLQIRITSLLRRQIALVAKKRQCTVSEAMRRLISEAHYTEQCIMQSQAAHADRKEGKK